ncbi:MAG TPA: hypothetical protein VG204_04380 [Terriglobia bacterium]|nr:hypothetical protein [Terriglobia bacterium]
MAQRVERNASQTGSLETGHEIPVVNISRIERATSLRRKSELGDLRLPLLVELSPLYRIEDPLVAHLHQNAPQFLAEINAPWLPALRAGGLTAHDVVSNKNVAVFVVLAISKLDVLPLERKQFSQPQARPKGCQE